MKINAERPPVNRIPANPVLRLPRVGRLGTLPERRIQAAGFFRREFPTAPSEATKKGT